MHLQETNWKNKQRNQQTPKNKKYEHLTASLSVNAKKKKEKKS